MAVRVARLEDGSWAVDTPEGLRSLSGAYATTRAFFEQGGPGDARSAMTAGKPADRALRIVSPVTRDARFVCQATNYADHIRETGGDPAQVVNNIIFTKASSCIVPADAEIVKPPHVKLLDYEIELGLVLGRALDNPVSVTSDTLHQWVGGLVIVNDVTARDVQISHMQFHKSKSYRTFGPVGPWLVLPDPEEFARLFELQLTLRVDGEIRQQEFAREMIFKPAETLSELSQIMDLAPGDLIATGTPAGVALHPPGALIQKLAVFMNPRKRFAAFLRGQLKQSEYLQPGQVMTATIRTLDGALDLGEQCNRITG
jgi:2-keto-4-pentenoate hydratase/2-oxohepta-3-ene-1,7-dioic acid hydratase in catechol pathway